MFQTLNPAKVTVKLSVMRRGSKRRYRGMVYRFTLGWLSKSIFIQFSKN